MRATVAFGEFFFFLLTRDPSAIRSEAGPFCFGECHGSHANFHHTPGLIGDGQDTFTQPLALRGVSPLVSSGLGSAPWDFPSGGLIGVATSAAVDFPTSLHLDNGGAPGFQNHPGQIVWDQPLAQSDAATGSRPSWSFFTTGTSAPVDLSSLGLGSALASGHQNYGSQHVWDQTHSQIAPAAGASWGQPAIDLSSIGAFQPSNVDGRSIEAGVGLPTNTNLEGDFQWGIESNLAAPSAQCDDGNLIWQPALATASPSQQNQGPNQLLPATLTGLQSLAPVPALAATNTAGAIPRFQCTICPRAFKRDFERTRHEASVHGINRRLHLCPEPGCPKSHGNGFSRPDKLTEHLWKKHANMGYSKAA